MADTAFFMAVSPARVARRAVTTSKPSAAFCHHFDDQFRGILKIDVDHTTPITAAIEYSRHGRGGLAKTTAENHKRNSGISLSFRPKSLLRYDRGWGPMRKRFRRTRSLKDRLHSLKKGTNIFLFLVHRYNHRDETLFSVPA